MKNRIFYCEVSLTKVNHPSKGVEIRVLQQNTFRIDQIESERLPPF